MASPVFLLACAIYLLASPMAFSEVVEHTLNVQNRNVRLLCQEQVITAVNGSLPGPTIRVREGDTLVVHVLNNSPYNLTIHWHGVFQLLSAWADGPEYATQCPIRPKHSYTYRFNVTGQEGTLWWHAHSKWLRSTVYGALIIRPRAGRSYPFPKPHREYPIQFGEWWNANIMDVENEALVTGGIPNMSDAFTINGRPGDLYPCSQKDTHKIKVVRGKTYLLRIINAAMKNQFFFKIANHNMIIVAVDAVYTDPYVTDLVVIGPGQTTDVLFTADQSPASYYMAASPYFSALGLPFDTTTTTGIVVYEGTSSLSPLMPTLPAFNDTPTAHQFFSRITGLENGPHWVPVPSQVDEYMYITLGISLTRCEQNATCLGPMGHRIASSMNNASFELPNKLSMLEAFFHGVSGIYTEDFPDEPPVKFDYTNTDFSFDESLIFTSKSTKVKRLKFNATVEVVLQNTALATIENHPIHMHGFNFHVLAQGFGNYDAANDRKQFNLINPQIRNTIGVPSGGWAVLRFQANNPGVWLFHCHLDDHMLWGLSTAFVVENGPTPDTMLPPPPNDLPRC